MDRIKICQAVDEALFSKSKIDRESFGIEDSSIEVEAMLRSLPELFDGIYTLRRNCDRGGIEYVWGSRYDSQSQIPEQYLHSDFEQEYLQFLIRVDGHKISSVLEEGLEGDLITACPERVDE